MMEEQKLGWFERFARTTEKWIGSKWAFGFAVLTVLVWAAFGPYYHWSDTHQLVINTGTTIVTFLIVFLIQHTQTKDTTSLHVKLNELIRATENARNKTIEAEMLSEEELTRTLERIRKEARSGNPQ